uniref:L27 domain-containing protein n=1 Tax=Anopheles atroparvus TaxID=41427 RepID=A0A182IZQ0_ANOAO
MVRFGKKETTDKRQLLASMSSMHYDSSKQIDNAAFQHVRENLSDLNGRPEANETDLVFLQGILANPAVTQLIKNARAIDRAVYIYIHHLGRVYAPLEHSARPGGGEYAAAVSSFSTAAPHRRHVTPPLPPPTVSDVQMGSISASATEMTAVTSNIVYALHVDDALFGMLLLCNST